MLKGPGDVVEVVGGSKLQLRLGEYLHLASLVRFVPLNHALIVAFNVSLRAWSVDGVEYTGI